MRKAILIAVITLLLFTVGYVYWFYYNPKSDGTRSGVLQKFSRKGNIFKTHEGEMVQLGFGQRNGNITTDRFFFSVADEKIADSLEHHCQGKFVQVHYVQYRRSLAWRGEHYTQNTEPGQYIVDKIELVKEMPY